MPETIQRVAVITGASSGIGQSLAHALSRQGWGVGLIARRRNLVEELASNISNNGGKAVGFAADVVDAGQVRSAIARILDRFGRIDTMVVNAGIGGTIDVSNFDTDSFAEVINTNLIGAANSVAAVLDTMLKQNSGQLVAISSLAAYRGLPKSGSYCASKAGLSCFFESLRLDLRSTGIDITIIHPGFIKTPLTSGRSSQMPYLMDLEDATHRIMNAITRRKKSYAFPWQLATLVRLGMIMPTWMYDSIAIRNSFRE